jgi:acyl-CoA thioesterase
VAEREPRDGAATATDDDTGAAAAHARGDDVAASAAGPFERDTAVRREGPRGRETTFAADVSPDWRAGRGPHGGYLAAMLLRALIESVDEPERAPRSLTIHYARAPEPGPVQIRTTIEREGRSLSTLAARIEQQGKLIALALSAFSVEWSGPQIADLPLPDVRPPGSERTPGAALAFGGPPFTANLVMQPRLGGRPFAGGSQPMEIGAWLGLGEARALDALTLAFFSDALIPAPFMRIPRPAAAPTIDLSIHFRTNLSRRAAPETSHDAQHELVFARVRAGVIQEGFFEEDGVIWATDGTVLAQSRQLAILLPQPIG